MTKVNTCTKFQAIYGCNNNNKKRKTFIYSFLIFCFTFNSSFNFDPTVKEIKSEYNISKISNKKKIKETILAKKSKPFRFYN